MKRKSWLRFAIIGIVLLVLAYGTLGLHELGHISYQVAAYLAGASAFAGLFLLIFLFAFPAIVTGLYRGLGGDQSFIVSNVRSYAFFFRLFIIEERDGEGRRK
jgi:hypothetical protein